MKQTLVDYNDICFENITLKMEVESLSDDALLDECNNILSGFQDTEDIDDILVNYFKTGKISKDERSKAESIYLLAYGDFGWEV
jgi:preprotein translocase subunit SecA